ncbi:Mg/Co/Ni transporter MgtE [Enterococcus sp. PF1-24]|uniref:hypothetical protein n=1 Tax=unclassified Enterococcus TaxID=2608891 RepID=UPI002473CAA7|nr:MULTISPECIES: hypothetical protein [unclassified Enterococcus]MDH6365249.1 Mg/Co/Ni transporter MgtE [Enterococcus sp. PFB1-1]MDH6402350.1 Mg/Co/Ni transporter MgtE [Enterococcus sp. PF1-24]
MTYVLCGCVIFLTHFIIQRYWQKFNLSFVKLLALTLLLLLVTVVVSTLIGSLLPMILATLITTVVLQNAYLQRSIKLK